MSTVAQKIAKNNYIRITETNAMTVTAVANTDFVFDVPAGALDITFTTITTTAFTAVTDMTIQIGSASTGAQYVAATTVKALGRKGHTLVDAAAADYLSFPGPVYVRLIQTGGSTAVGAATLVINYSLPTT